MKHYRKAITVAVTFAIVYALDLAGLAVSNLPAYGLALTDLREPVVEMLIQLGTAMVGMIAQPDKDDPRSLWSQWRWIVGGVIVLLALIGLAILVL